MTRPALGRAWKYPRASALPRVKLGITPGHNLKNKLHKNTLHDGKDLACAADNERGWHQTPTYCENDRVSPTRSLSHAFARAQSSSEAPKYNAWQAGTECARAAGAPSYRRRWSASALPTHMKTHEK